jgi:hypothetical protein
MICDILTANKTSENKTGDFKKCESDAWNISRFGHLTCNVHKSPSDVYLYPDNDEDREEVISRLALRDDGEKAVLDYRKTFMKGAKVNVTS